MSSGVKYGPVTSDDSAGVFKTAKQFWSAVKDFYMTNPIARASVTMAECAAVATGAAKLAAE